ncbi:hypothetical protein Mapa_006597 [Marchantia paleacea]|nr:hypothetical protein Mapa_006597 [Marchantia paleacea]
MAAARQALCSSGGIDAVHGHGRGRARCDTRKSFATPKKVGVCHFHAQRSPICRLRCVAEPEPNDFWTRVQKAWRILIGTTSERQRVKQRFNNLLVRDRGFSSTNLARLYNVAKGAIEQHVDLERDEETEVTAYVERVGQLRLDFRVKRVKSILEDEPYAGVPMSISDSELKSEAGSKLGLEERREEEVEEHQRYEHQVDVNPSAVVPDLELVSALQSSSDVHTLSCASIIEDRERTVFEVER